MQQQQEQLFKTTQQNSVSTSWSLTQFYFLSFDIEYEHFTIRLFTAHTHTDMKFQ